MYAIEFWYAAPSYLSNTINVPQKKSVRIIYNLPFNDHTQNYFVLSGILTLPCLYKRSILLYMLKTLKFEYDSYFLSLLERNAEIHSLNTRRADNFVLPLYRRSTTEIVFCSVVLSCGTICLRR